MSISPQRIIIDDYPKRKSSPKPNSLARKEPAVNSRTRIRDQIIAKKRDKKQERYNNILFEPQSAKTSQVQIAISELESESYVPLTLLREHAQPQVFHTLMKSFSSLNSVADTAEAFRADISSDVIPELKRFNDNIETLKSEGVRMDHKIDGDTLASVSAHFSDFMMLILVITVVCVIQPKTRNEKICVSVTVAALVVTRVSLKAFLESSKFSNWFKKESAIQPESFNAEVSDMLCSLVNMYVCYDHGKDLFSPKKFVRIMSDLGRANASFQSIMSGMTKVVSFIYEGIDSWITGRPFFLSSGHGFIDAFVKEAKEIIDMYEKKTLYNLNSSVDRVNEAIELGETINLKVPSLPSYAGLRLQITGLNTELKRIRKAIMASNFRFSGIRQEPVTILLRGPPGVYKSACLQHLAHAVNAITMTDTEYALYKEQPGTGIYNRQFENKYWDGYSQQHNVVFFDDILQARDVVGEPDNEAMNLIRCANVFEAQLHCAAIESKGTTNFRSKFIMATTNSKEIKLESINDIGAFMRRIDLCYDVSPKLEYCVDPAAPIWSRRFDWSKLPLYKEGDMLEEGKPVPKEWIGQSRIEVGMLEFHEQRLEGRATSTPSFESSGLTLLFPEVVADLIDSYNTKKQHHSIYMSQLEKTLNDYRLGPDEEMYDKSGVFDGIELDDIARPESGRSFTSPSTGRRLHVYGNVPVPMPMPEWTRGSLLIGDEELVWWRHFVFGDDAEEILTMLRGMKLENGYAYLLLMRCVYIARDCFFLHPRFVYSVMAWIEHVADEYLNRFVDDWTDPDQFTWCHDRNAQERMSFLSAYIDLCNNELARVSLELAERTGESTNYVYRPESGKGKGAARVMDDEDFPYNEKRHPLVSGPFSFIVPSPETFGDLSLLKGKDKSFYESVVLLSKLFVLSSKHYLGNDSIVFADDAYEAVMKTYDGSWDVGKDPDPYLQSALEYYLKTPRGSRYRVDDEIITSVLQREESKPSPIEEKIMSVYKSCMAYLVSIPGLGVSTSVVKHQFYTNPVIVRFFKYIVGFTSLRFAIIGIQALVKNFFPADDLTAEPNSDERSNRVQRGRFGRKMKQQKASPHSIVRTNENLTSVMKMIMKSNTFLMYIPVPLDERVPRTKHYCIGSILGLRGRTMLLPYHFVDLVDSKKDHGEVKWNDKIYFERPGYSHKFFEMTVDEFLGGAHATDFGEKRDMITLVMPLRFQPVRDITKFFASQKQHDLYSTVNGVLVVPSAPDTVEYHSVTIRRSNVPAVISDDEFEEYRVENTYVYNARTSAGDCGGILHVDDKTKHSVIIGMHIAGFAQKEVGISTILTYEFIMQMLAESGDSYKEVDQLDIPLVPPEKDIPNMVVLGQAQCKTPGRMGRSKIARSVLYGEVCEVKKAPARLMPFTNPEGVRIDPLDIAVSSYCTPEVYFDYDSLCSARDSLADMLGNVSVKSVEKRVFTFEEGVLGDGPGSEFGSVPRTKSAGYPYNVMSGITSKARFFGMGDDYDLSNPECDQLRKECDEVIMNAEKGIRMTHIFTDALKDERRSKAKVQAGKTRMFSGSPTPLLIVSRQYFGAFQKWIILNRITNGIAIGVNEYSSDWNLIARNVEKFGKGLHNVGAGDYQGFDQKHKPAIMWEILKIIQDWYGYEDQKATNVRHILWYELVNSKHLVDGLLVSWPSSMPSGHPLTALVNCMYNHILFRLSWIDLINPVSKDAHSFNKAAYLVVLGDDNVFSVVLQYASVFTEGNLSECMKKYGEVYTPEDKELTCFGTTLRRIDQVTFLKRRFRYDRSHSRYLAPLDLDAILDILNWNKDGANSIGDTEANVSTVLHELTLHGQETFETWKGKILSAVDKHSELSRPPVTTFNTLIREVLDREVGYEGSPRFFTDYDERRANSAAPQSSSRRFGKEQAGLFSLTSRMASRQTRVYPGIRGKCTGLAQPLYYN